VAPGRAYDSCVAGAGDSLSAAPRLLAFIVVWHATHGAARCAPSSANENLACAAASIVDGRKPFVS
jgi:hypothetical protein